MVMKNDIIHRLESLDLGNKSPLKLFVWRTRRFLRDTFQGVDVFDAEKPRAGFLLKVRSLYIAVDESLSKRYPNFLKRTPKRVALSQVKDALTEHGYTIVDSDTTKPWGGFYRLADNEIERFMIDFFPGLTLGEAQLGQPSIELSPKILIVSPGQRLSWQYHHRRAELWRFLTQGNYYKSDTDTAGPRQSIKAGQTIQFGRGERHRLAGTRDSYVVVAEIWQHTDPSKPSDEADIVRLEDDYDRS